MLPFMPPETPDHEPPESGDFILATYREIALRFGLGGPNAARTKVKRAGWVSEPANHPADALRIRVPRDGWGQAGETPPRAPKGRAFLKSRDSPSQEEDTHHLRALEEHLATLRDRLADAEQRIAREAERADRAEIQVDREAGRADRAEFELGREREAARRLAEQIAALANDVARLATPAGRAPRPPAGDAG
jgi:hypothetical protein